MRRYKQLDPYFLILSSFYRRIEVEMTGILEDVAIIGAGVGVSASCFVASST